MDLLTVRAASGRVPRDGGGCIEEEPALVPNSYYYRQLIASGELVEVHDSPSDPTPGSPAEAGAPRQRSPRTSGAPKGDSDSQPSSQESAT